jgi:mRNA interferase MazF
VPSRGEVWLVDLGMVEKVRPALVLSRECEAADRNLITIIPHTTTLRASRLEVNVPLSFLKQGAFLAQSPATVSAARALKYLGRISDSEIRIIEDALLDWLGIQKR